MNLTDVSEPKPPEQRGLQCPKCGCAHWRVVYTRPRPGGRLVRRRECRHCGKTVITTERVNG
jgi:transcriptional regulator NrdR family protein